MSDKHMPYAVFRLRDNKLIGIWVNTLGCCTYIIGDDVDK